MAPKILIVSPLDAEENVRRIISKHASSMSESTGDIDTIFRKANLLSYADETSRLISKKAPQDAATRILLFESVQHKETFGSGFDYRAANSFNGVAQFEKAFPNILRQSGLDWKTEAINYLGLWSHGLIDELQINRWLTQFADLGEEWIGEHLLKNIDFWSAHRIREALNCNEKTLSDFKILGLKRGEAGKSGDVIANILKKQFSHLQIPAPQIEDFYQICTNPNRLQYESILFIEDCLLTGTEITKYLGKLLGISQEKNPNSTLQPIDDPQWLRTTKIEFRFAVWTELGFHRLKKFIDTQGLNATIQCSLLGKLDILTDEGRSAIANNSINHPEIDGWPSDPERQIDCVAFRGAGRRNKKAPLLRSFCQAIGEQLLRNYLSRNGWTWNESRVKIAALGMHGFGLNVAFTHSVPKSTLPLLWMDGEIQYNNKRLNWQPLFEFA